VSLTDLGPELADWTAWALQLEKPSPVPVGGPRQDVVDFERGITAIWRGLSSWFGGGSNAPKWNAQQAMGQLWGSLTQLGDLVAAFWSANSADHVHIWNALWGGITSTANSLEQWTLGQIIGVEQALASYINTTVGGMGARLGADINRVTGWLAGETQARARADAQVAAGAAAYTNLIGGIITGWLKGEEATRAAGDVSTLARGVAYTDTTGARITGWLQAEETTRAAADTTVLEQSRAYTNTVGNAAIATAAKTAGSLVQSLQAKLSPAINALKTETDECLKPLCDTVTPNAKSLGNLGHLLTGLSDAALWAALVALLAEAAHDPAAAVSDVEAALGGAVEGVYRGVADLIGVG